MSDIDQALMVLMGFSHGTYLGKKLIVNTSPTLTRAVTPNARGGSKVTLAGTNLGNSSVNNQITLDGSPFSPTPEITSWGDEAITFVFSEAPQGSPYDFGKQKPLGVVVGGQESNTVPINFAIPEMRRLTSKSNIMTLSGAGFGGKTANAKLSAGVGEDKQTISTDTWEDAAITFKDVEIVHEAQRALGARISPTLDVDWKTFGPKELVVTQGK